MGMRTLAFESQVTLAEDMRFGKETSFIDHLRDNAAHTMARMAIKDAARYERIDPDKEELKRNPNAAIRHRWTIGVERDMTEIEAREKQIDEARRKGLSEAAEFILSQVATHERADYGHCKHALVHQLIDLAEKLTRMSVGEKA